jgi:hypothetical protein
MDLLAAFLLLILDLFSRSQSVSKNSLGPDVPPVLLSMTWLTELRLAYCGLKRLSGRISELRALTVLDYTLNPLRRLPCELTYIPNWGWGATSANREWLLRTYAGPQLAGLAAMLLLKSSPVFPRDIAR